MAMRLLTPLLLLLALLSGCGDEQPAATGNAAKPATPQLQVDEPGQLRVITPRRPQGLGYLPRSGLPQTEEYKLLELYAESVGLELVPVRVDGYDRLLPTLLAGEGDIIANNLTVTASRQEKIDFTTPVAFVHEQLIGRRGETPTSAHELEGRRVAVHRSDSFYETLLTLQKQPYQPPFEIVEVSEQISTETLLEAVAAGDYDLTVADSNVMDVMLGYRDDLEVGFNLGRLRPIAWGVAPDADELLESINSFLGQYHLASEEERLSTDDLAAIKKRGVLRVLTRNNATTYFLWRGELLGFEYELAKRFADNHGLRLEVVVPPSRDLLIPWLLEGRGDIVAAAMTMSEKREAKGVAFSRHYNQVSEILVAPAGSEGLETVEDLNGRTVVARPSSSYWQHLEALRQQGIDVELVAAPETAETEELIDQVARGEIPLTVADSHILDMELTWRDDIEGAFPLGEPQQHGWVAREGNPQLLQAVNGFFKKEYRGLFFNVTYNKYFKNSKRIRSHVEERIDASGESELSPYDELVRRYAEEYGFDWRLIVSQMYQESRFDPNAKSWVGALGLLQVMPRTAKELGIGDLRDPQQGIHAGVQYLDWLRLRFEPELAMAERTWFALASYNAGVGHVRDARRLARQKGWDPDRWFDNVERAMLLLARKEYARKAKHGYVRGHEPVNYVRQIRDRYLAYVKLKGESLAALEE
jgi:membrane-bound lytic murein transglycosylase F